VDYSEHHNQRRLLAAGCLVAVAGDSVLRRHRHLEDSVAHQLQLRHLLPDFSARRNQRPHLLVDLVVSVQPQLLLQHLVPHQLADCSGVDHQHLVNPLRLLRQLSVPHQREDCLVD
jgi:propanediol utilization protein